MVTIKKTDKGYELYWFGRELIDIAPDLATAKLWKKQNEAWARGEDLYSFKCRD